MLFVLTGLTGKTSNMTGSTEEQSSESLGSILLPGALFEKFNDTMPLQMVFGVYRTPNIFPRASGLSSSMAIASSIVSTTVLGQSEVQNMAEDVNITMTLTSEVLSVHATLTGFIDIFAYRVNHFTFCLFISIVVSSTCVYVLGHC